MKQKNQEPPVRMKKEHPSSELPAIQRDALIATLKERFEQHMDRHKGIQWSKVQAKLKASPKKLWSINQMEKTGGEPDIIDYDSQTGEYIFCDCSPESPTGRRNTSYDPDSQQSRKENKPVDNAVGMASAMGIELLTEEEYHQLQKKETFDTKTSSWLKTPSGVRKLGGAIFGDYRYGRVFIYHNGAESYYASRGFRGLLRV